ncbi:cyclic pyranopterin monophosphate synthase MoaC, partial [Gordonia sp. UBA5067]
MAADDVGRELTHLDETGAAHMVDVSGKAVTTRTAVAGGVFRTTADVIALIGSGSHRKGDVLAVARIAAIMGAKRTADLIPLCHPLPLDSVDVEFAIDADRITVTATAVTTGRTGVEMEALTAVSVAGLTLHDMVKAVDPAATMTEVGLHRKTGGRSGEWTRAASARPAPTAARTVAPGV